MIQVKVVRVEHLGNISSQRKPGEKKVRNGEKKVRKHGKIVKKKWKRLREKSEKLYWATFCPIIKDLKFISA